MMGVRQDPSDDRASRPGQPQTIAEAFVGRTRELEELRAGLPDIERNRGRFFLICGEPGVGKTRLVERLADEAAAGGILVHWGRCWEGGGAPAFWPWLQILRHCLRDVDETWLRRAIDGRRRHDLAQILPEVEADGAPAVRNLGDGETETARFQLHDAVATFLKAQARERMRLLVLEDVHAGDIPTLRLLHFVTHNLFDAPLSVVATYREAELLSQPALAERFGDLGYGAHKITLGGLTRLEVERFVTLTVGPIGSRVVDAIYTVTEGNPFFVTEVLRVLLAEHRLDGIREEQLQAVLPHRVREAVHRHLQPLPDSTRAVLAAASVFGKEFDVSLLQQAWGHVEPPYRCQDVDTAAALAQAASAGVVVSSMPERFSFSHALVRDALHAALPVAQRCALHRAIAIAMETGWSASGQPPFAEIAHHYLAAASDVESAEKAIHYSRLAGDQEMKCLAFEGARAHYQRALECLERWADRNAPATRARRAELLQALAWAHRQSGDGEQASEMFFQVTQIARDSGAIDLFARAAIDLEAFQVGSYSPRWVALLEEALRLLPSGDSTTRALTMASLAAALYHSGQLEPREMLSRAAVEMARRLGDPPTLSKVLRLRELAIWVPEYLDERVANAREHMLLAQQLGDEPMMRQMVIWQFLGAFEHGVLAEIEAAVTAYWQIEGTDRDPMYHWVGSTWRPALALLHGELEAAEPLTQESLQLGMAVHRDLSLAAYGAQMLVLRLEQGRPDDYLATLEAALLQSPVERAEIPAILALAYAEAGRLDESRQQFERLAPQNFGGVPKDLNWLAITAMLAWVCHHLDDRERAITLRQLLAPFADRVTLISVGVATWGAVARFLGLLETTLKNWDAAARHFAAAAATHEGLRAPALLARTQIDHATMLVRAGRADEARPLLASGIDQARRLGMTGLVSRGEALAAPHSVAPRPEPASRPGDGSPTRFARNGDLWNVAFEGHEIGIKHSRGLAQIAFLLRHPGQEVHVLDLLDATDDKPVARVASDAGEHLDAAARDAYRHRLQELRDELAEAEAWSDLGRSQSLQNEADFLARELGRAFGLSGRERRAGSASERARVSVTRTISRALQTIARHHPVLGQHLDRTLHTGTFCRYAPDPRTPIDWQA